MTSAELKPCPFCGGRAKYENDMQIGGIKFEGWGIVHCIECGRSDGRVYNSEIYTTAAWNTRAAPKIKHLVWCHHPAGLVASNGMGGSYIINTRYVRPMWLKWPGGHGPDAETVVEMQAAAQADYTRRILEVLE